MKCQLTITPRGVVANLELGERSLVLFPSPPFSPIPSFSLLSPSPTLHTHSIPSKLLQFASSTTVTSYTRHKVHAQLCFCLLHASYAPPVWGGISVAPCLCVCLSVCFMPARNSTTENL